MSTVDTMVELLKKADEAYYEKGEPILSDASYDAYFRSLKAIDPGNSYLQKIGSKVLESDTTLARVIPMGTLENVTLDRIPMFLTQVYYPSGYFILQPKYDGMSCECIYQDGKFVLAASRGDGEVGQDITEALINKVPKNLPRKDFHSIRGELIIKKEHEEELRKAGYKSLRNVVAGLVKSKSDLLKLVDFVVFDVLMLNDHTFHRNDRLVLAKDFGFTIAETFIYAVDEISPVLNHWNSYKETLPYQTDGVVIKTLDITLKHEDWRHPKRMFAFKFELKTKNTVLRKVIWELGSQSNKLIPVGVYDPVDFGGVQLTRCSLHGLRTIKKKNIKIGAVVEIGRAQEVIPFLKSVVDDSLGEDVSYPENCPYCSSEIVLENDEPCCLNDDCRQKQLLELQHFSKTVGVKGFAGKTIEKLYDSAAVLTIPDFYTFDLAVIDSIPGLGEKTKKLVLKFREKEILYRRFLEACGLRGIKAAFFKKLKALDLDPLDLINTSEEALLKLREEKELVGVGEKTITLFISERDRQKYKISKILAHAKISGRE